MTKYRAEPDTDATDPREDWGSDGQVDLYVVRDWSSPFRIVTNAPGPTQLWERLLDYGMSLEKAVAGVQRRFPRYFIALETVRGYSQSDWWDVLIVAKCDESDARTEFDRFAHYLRGDVWTVEEIETEVCSLGHEHEDVVLSLSGIYADSEEQAIDYFKETN